MAVKTQAKTKAKAKSATAVAVDRIMELKKLIDATAPAAKEMAKLVADLRAQAMTQDDDQVVSYEGDTGTVVFGESAKTRELTDLKAAKKALGNDVFFEVATITLGDLDKYLTPAELAPLIKEGRGGRKISVLPK